jgi:hypothetical protein
MSKILKICNYNESQNVCGSYIWSRRNKQESGLNTFFFKIVMKNKAFKSLGSVFET